MSKVTISTENDELLKYFLELADLCDCDADSDDIEYVAGTPYTRIEDDKKLSKEEKEELITKRLIEILDSVSDDTDEE